MIAVEEPVDLGAVVAAAEAPGWNVRRSWSMRATSVDRGWPGAAEAGRHRAPP